MKQTIIRFSPSRFLAHLLWMGMLVSVGGTAIAQTIPKLDSLEQALESTWQDTARLALFDALKDVYHNVNPTEALRYADSVILWAQKVGDAKRYYQGQYAKAAGFQALGENDSALRYIQLALDGASQMGIQTDIIDCYNLLGAVFHRQGNYLAALNAYQEGLTLSRTTSDTVNMYTIMVNVADLYDLQREWQLERDTYEEALSLIIAAKGERSFAAAVVYTNLGGIDSIPDKTAIQYLDKALDIFSANHQVNGEAHAHVMLGYRSHIQGQYQSSIEHYQAAADIWKQPEVNYKPGLMTAYGGLARNYIYTGAFQQGRNLSDQAIAIGEEYNLRPELAEVYLTRASLEEAADRPAAALDFFKKGTKLSETLLNESLTQKLAQSRVQFATEEKEKELAQAERDLAQGELELSRQQSETNVILLMSAILLLAVIGVFLYLRNRQRLQRKETELALQLKQAEAASLRELDTLKSRFFANISHEFRTPLTLILTPIQQMLDGRLPGNPTTYLQMMQRNGNRLLQLINQLLDLSRLEANRMEVHLIRADIGDFIRQLAAQYESLAMSRHIHFHRDLPRHSIETAFDPDKLEKSISNLLSNAFKFTPEEGDVWLRLEQVDDQLEIVVQDNGIGMDEEQVAHVFDRFYRVESEGYEGAGIGLALVKELTELANGSVSVSSDLGKGSTFVLTLPLLLEEEAPTETWEAPTPIVHSYLVAESPEAITATDIERKPQLLIVEDNVDVQALLRDLLQADYDIHLAKEGGEGLTLARTHIPDLVISDVMMPGMGGNEFTRRLKEDVLTSHIPVIQLTARAGQEDKLEGLGIGADDFIAKPFDGRELRLKLHNLLEQRERIRKKFGKEVVRLGPTEVEMPSADQQFLQRVIAVIETYMQDEAFSIEDLGREVGLSRSQLHRKLKALTDQSPSVFLRSIRLQRAHSMLKQAVGSIAEVAYQVGFGSPAYFSKCFKDEFGISPGEVRKA